MRAITAGLCVLIAALAIFFITLAIHGAWARNFGQWEYSPPEVRAWYRSLMQPDTMVSCCGEGDAYWADEYHMEGEKLIAVVTDDRDDKPLGRGHVPVGTKYVVPNNKIVDVTKQRGNPVGHTIIFLGTIWVERPPEERSVLCWVGGGGF